MPATRSCSAAAAATRLCSAVAAAAWARRRAPAGAAASHQLVLVAAPEGIRRVHEAHPDVTLYTASVDQGLNEDGYIVPGLGDAGDKIFGTK